MNSIQLENELAAKKKKIDDYQRELFLMQKEVVADEKKLAKLLDCERENKERDYFKSLGFEYDPNDLAGFNKAIGNSYLVFTKKAEFVKVVAIPKDFPNIIQLEKWLMQEKLYGHSLRSFQERSIGWYDRPLLEQLESLDWKVTKSGKLAKTEW